MTTGYFERVLKYSPTNFWVNNATREEARLAVANGAAGCTQNPSYCAKMLFHPTEGEYARSVLAEILKEESDADAAITRLQRTLIAEICRVFLPEFSKSGGRAGWVSIQANPFCETVEHIVEAARYNRAAAPNVIAKIPATKNGLEAMAILVREGVPILATEVMSLDQAADVCKLYDQETALMENPPAMILAQIAGIFDEHLADEGARHSIDIDSDLIFQAGTAMAKKMYAMMQKKGSRCGFMSGGARGLHHFTEFVGVGGCVTINWEGFAYDLLTQNPPVIDRFCTPISPIVEDELLKKLPDFRKSYFTGSLLPDEYEDFGPVARFRGMFEKGWQRVRDYIEHGV